MFNLAESEVNELAKKNSFNRNVTEKVLLFIVLHVRTSLAHII